MERTHVGDKVVETVEDPVVSRCGLAGRCPEEVGDEVSSDLEIALLYTYSTNRKAYQSSTGRTV